MKKLSKEQQLEILRDCLGDCSHCNHLIRQYHRLIGKAVRKSFTVKNLPFPENDVLEELVNETWLNIFDKHCKKLKQYQPDKGKGLSGWLSMIAYQTAAMYLRKNKTNSVPLEEDNKELLKEMMKISKNTERQIESSEQLYIIRKYMEEELTDQERLVSKLHFLDGLSYQEISELLNKKADLIYPLISKAKKKIKDCLEKADQI